MSKNFKKEKLKKLKTDEQITIWTNIWTNNLKREKTEENRHTLSCLWDNIKWYNTCESQRERREGTEPKKNLKKKNVWNFQFVEKQQLADIISLANSKKNKMDSSWTSEIFKKLS